MLGQMLAELAKVDAWIDEAGADIYKTQPLAQDWARVSKIAEELGEAVNELILFTGQSPRKPQTDNIRPLLDELADVVITAMCAMIHFTKDPAQVGGIIVDKTHAISTRMVEAKVQARREATVKPGDLAEAAMQRWLKRVGGEDGYKRTMTHPLLGE